MRVIVRSVDSSSSELHVEDGETWGRLCQRFVETRLPHPPRLLQLLASLHPDERMGRYRLRYGDGNSTVIEPTWSIAGHNSSAPIISWSSSDAEVEANVTLRCDSRECSPREKADCEEWDDNSKITVRLHVEKVGEEDDDDDDESPGVLPTTRTPFPVDDGETSVLRVREHVRFAGVVDKFSISKYLESDDWEEEEGGTEVTTQGPAKEGKGKTRKQKKDKRTSAESAKKSNEDDEGKKEEQQSATKEAKQSKKAKLVPSVAALKAAEETAEEKGAASDEAPTTEEAPAKKSDTRSKKKKGSKETPQKKGTSAKTSPAEKTTVVTPTATSTPGKEEKDTHEKSKKGGAGTAEKRDDDNDETKGPVVEKPKRPLNAYMLFGKEMRPAIKEGSPDASPQEIMAKIGEAYRALGDDEKKRYTDAADAAMAKFKQEHGDGALATKRSSAKKKKKTKQTTDNDDGDGKAAAAPPPAKKRQTLSGDAFALIPATPAEGLPEGWTIKNVPRRTGKQCDRYWFSPARGYKFRSMAEVKRCRESLDRAVVVGGGKEELESAAMESYLGEKKDGGSAGRKKRKASVGDDGRGAGKKRKTAAGPSAVKKQGDGNVGDEGGAAKEDGKIETAAVAVTQEEGDENADKDGDGAKDAGIGESTAGDGKEDGSNGNAADDGVVGKDASGGKSSKKKKRKKSTGSSKKKDKGDGNAGDDGVEAKGDVKGKSGSKKKRKAKSKNKDDKVIVKAEEKTISDHEDEIPEAWDA